MLCDMSILQNLRLKDPLSPIGQTAVNKDPKARTMVSRSPRLHLTTRPGASQPPSTSKVFYVHGDSFPQCGQFSLGIQMGVKSSRENLRVVASCLRITSPFGWQTKKARVAPNATIDQIW